MGEEHRDFASPPRDGFALFTVALWLRGLSVHAPPFLDRTCVHESIGRDSSCANPSRAAPVRPRTGAFGAGCMGWRPRRRTRTRRRLTRPRPGSRGRARHRRGGRDAAHTLDKSGFRAHPPRKGWVELLLGGEGAGAGDVVLDGLGLRAVGRPTLPCPLRAAGEAAWPPCSDLRPDRRRQTGNRAACVRRTGDRHAATARPLTIRQVASWFGSCALRKAATTRGSNCEPDPAAELRSRRGVGMLGR